MKKRVRVICAVLASILILTGCNIMAAVYENEEKIVSGSDSYNLNVFRSATEDRVYTASADKMEGMLTVWRYNAEEDTELDFSCSLNVETGKAKLVLISPDNEVTTLVEMKGGEPSVSAITTLPIQKGKNRIKLVAGEKTKLEVTIEIPKGNYED